MKHVKKAFAALAVVGVALLSACGSEANDAQVASANLSVAADNFELNRRIIFYNGITDKYMFTIEGRCNIDVDEIEHQLVVNCKVGENPDTYKKHFLGLSDNVSYIVEQLEAVNVSRWHYRVVFKPETIIPDITRPS